MNLYNKIMLYFWLIAGTIITVGVTLKMFGEGLPNGWLKWRFYYLFAVLCFVMYFLRKLMIRRMEKHMVFLENKAKEEENKKK